MRTLSIRSKSLVCMLLFMVTGVLLAQSVEEYRLKSAYIERITRFIKWPSGKKPAQKDYFVIAVAGTNPFKGKLKTYFKNQKISQKPVKVINISAPNQLHKCDMAFVSTSEEIRLDSYLRNAKKHKVLLISDKKSFAEKGIHFNLVSKKSRIVIYINYSSIKSDGFTVESILLDYSEIVGSDLRELITK